MLSEFFAFREEPFGATPDPRCLFDSSTHREALASLRYAYVSNRGFTALIAPPGMGKTTLLMQFLQDIRTCCRSVFVFETQCDSAGLLRYILRDLGIRPARELDEMHEQLKVVLLEEARAGRRVVAVVDEAQNLSDEALEMLRLLTNFETPQAKLIQIVLAGQLPLADKLMRPSLEQLRQRISTICYLEPFSRQESAAYIHYRLEQAGYKGAPLFQTDALGKILEAGQGYPRILNNLCFNTLSLCHAMKCKQVDQNMVAEVVADLELIRQPKERATHSAAGAEAPAERVTRLAGWATVAVLLLAAGAGLVLHFLQRPFWNHRPAAQSQNDSALAFQKAADAKTKGVSVPGLLPAQTPELSVTGKSVRGAGSLGLAPVQVTVKPNETLHDLSVRYLGTWNLKRLQEIEALNPRLTNIDHVEADQTIWLPAPVIGVTPANLSERAQRGNQP